MPTPTPGSDLQRRIDAIRWYHEIDFGNGVRSRSCAPDIEAQGHRALWRFIEMQLDRIDFTGKTVLDIGCWDGLWSFYAERRGAAHVVALDDFTQNWSTPDGLLLAREALGSSVEVIPDCSIYDVARIGRQFDIVLCLGLFYHLWDPFYAFAQVRQCCQPGGTMVAEGNITDAVPPHALYFTAQLQVSRFTPSREALDELLRATYFQPTSLVGINPISPQPKTAAWGRLPPAGVNRAVVVTTAMAWENPVHLYRPPFGLHAFDPRFR